jgi:glycosyltransferase involved in cell wall biosynthesis
MTTSSAPTGSSRVPSHVLIAIPAYNEEQTIEAVVHAVRSAAPQFDVLVVDDGSNDATEATLRRLDVTTATHLCNLGYGRAVQTAIKYADRHGYEALITFDADGQHRAQDIGPLYKAFSSGAFDLLIGSRFVQTRQYDMEPLLRRMGMRLFSALIALLFRQRVYDTSSGLKVIPRRLFGPLMFRPFVDLHAEAIAYLLTLGYRVGEHPITVDRRRHGQSMYTALRVVTYPLKVSLLMALGIIDARLMPRGSREH